jgi:Spy/CpxP family protein refolding chaperone
MKPTTSLMSLMLAGAFAFGCASETAVTDSAAVGDEAPAAAEEEAAPVADASEEEAAPRAKNKAKNKLRDRGANMREGKGPLAPFLAGMRKLDLSPEQQAKLGELKKSLRPGDAADGALASALADAIESGNVDAAAFDSELDAVEARAAARATALQSALDTLHDTLTPEQRTELVKTIEDHPKRARGEKAAAGGAMVIQRLARELDLSDQQVADIKAAAAKRPPLDKEAADLDGMLDAFAADDFDAAKAGVGANMPKNARARAEHLIQTVSDILPILEPAQRTELAQLIEDRLASAKPHKKAGKARKR